MSPDSRQQLDDKQEAFSEGAREGHRSDRLLWALIVLVCLALVLGGVGLVLNARTSDSAQQDAIDAQNRAAAAQTLALLNKTALAVQKLQGDKTLRCLTRSRNSGKCLKIQAGKPGSKGGLGPVGQSGAAGGTGPRGLPGPAGLRGPRGFTGPQGPRGDTGAAGVAGTNGVDGSAGKAGGTGDQGPKGDTAGPAGADGAPGAQGPVGPQGPEGPQGPAGPAGPPAPGP